MNLLLKLGLKPDGEIDLNGDGDAVRLFSIEYGPGPAAIDVSGS